MQPEERKSAIEHALVGHLDAVHVVVVDHSGAHAGHPGAAAGGGHFDITVVSPRFEGLSKVAAQRLVYQALGDLMEREIHALTMHLFTPEDWRGRG